jgi:hypothetical protein
MKPIIKVPRDECNRLQRDLAPYFDAHDAHGYRTADKLVGDEKKARDQSAKSEPVMKNVDGTLRRLSV